MKKLLFICAMALPFVACKTTSYPNEVSSVAVPSGQTLEQGTLWLQASGYGSDAESARVDAEKAAFSKLLFQGVPGTQWSQPMVPDESVSKRDHAAFYEQFLEKGGYRDMIITSSPGPLNKVEGNKRMDVQMKVDMNALRRHLEKNEIIRKFGL